MISAILIFTLIFTIGFALFANYAELFGKAFAIAFLVIVLFPATILGLIINLMGGVDGQAGKTKQN